MTSKNEIIVALKHDAAVARQHLATSLSLLERSQNEIRSLESQVRGLTAMLYDGERFWRSMFSEAITPIWASLFGDGCSTGNTCNASNNVSQFGPAPPPQSATSESVHHSRLPLVTPARDASLLQMHTTTIMSTSVAPALLPMPLLWMQWSSEVANEWKQGLFDAVSDSNARLHVACSEAVNAASEEVVKLRAELRVTRYKAHHCLEDRERALVHRHSTEHKDVSDCLERVDCHLDHTTSLFVRAVADAAVAFASAAADVVNDHLVSRAVDETNAVVKEWLFSRLEELHVALYDNGANAGVRDTAHIHQEHGRNDGYSPPSMVSRFEQLLLLSPGAD